MKVVVRACGLAVALLALGGAPAWGQQQAATGLLAPCRLPGLAQEIRCGFVEMPETPGTSGGRVLRIRYAVVPAIAKVKAPDPVFVLAGGPGQSAMQVAPLTMGVFAQVNTRRDIVFVDQRGTGKSHPLVCPDDDRPTPFFEDLDMPAQLARIGGCLRKLEADPRQYATWIAVRDLDGVRAALGAERINLWGASYGTRVGLEYLRQFPDRVRSAVLDGVAPPDMRLPASFALDGQAALDRTVALCAKDAACSARYPNFARDLDALFVRFAGKPVTVTLHDPLTGRTQTVPLARDSMLGGLRTPLYAPPFAAMLPYVAERAAQDDFTPLSAMMSAFGGSGAMRLAWGMHFAVVCAEDLPRITAEDRAAAAATRFGANFIGLYEQACREVPHQPAPAEFYTLPKAQAPVLLLSGGADPATPPRHAELVAKALPNSRHLVAPNLGHGVSAQACAPELIARFVRQAGFDGIDGACLEKLPAPPFFRPPTGAQR